MRYANVGQAYDSLPCSKLISPINKAYIPSHAHSCLHDRKDIPAFEVATNMSPMVGSGYLLNDKTVLSPALLTLPNRQASQERGILGVMPQ